MQTPAHIDPFTGLSDGLIAELTVAGLAVHPSRDMRAVIEENEIRHDEYWNPLDGLIIADSICQLLLVGILDRYLLVTTPTFGLGGQSR